MNFWQRYISECRRMDILLKEATSELCPNCDFLFHEAEVMGCCGFCGDMNAYRDMGSSYWMSNETFLKLKIKYGWDERYGFLDLNTGCKIPRIYRADICLTFMCSKLKKMLGPEKVRMLNKLTSRILFARYGDQNNKMMKILDEEFV